MPLLLWIFDAFLALSHYVIFLKFIHAHTNWQLFDLFWFAQLNMNNNKNANTGIISAKRKKNNAFNWFMNLIFYKFNVEEKWKNHVICVAYAMFLSQWKELLVAFNRYGTRTALVKSKTTPIQIKTSNKTIIHDFNEKKISAVTFEKQM